MKQSLVARKPSLKKDFLFFPANILTCPTVWLPLRCEEACRVDSFKRWATMNPYITYFANERIDPDSSPWRALRVIRKSVIEKVFRNDCAQTLGDVAFYFKSGQLCRDQKEN